MSDFDEHCHGPSHTALKGILTLRPFKNAFLMCEERQFIVYLQSKKERDCMKSRCNKVGTYQNKKRKVGNSKNQKESGSSRRSCLLHNGLQRRGSYFLCPLLYIILHINVKCQRLSDKFFLHQLRNGIQSKTPRGRGDRSQTDL